MVSLMRCSIMMAHRGSFVGEILATAAGNTATQTGAATPPIKTTVVDGE
jgi:hypothetical protein